MKIRRPNKFRQGEDPERVERYLATELQSTLADLTTALNNLTFRSNFKCEIVPVVIPASATNFEVRHNLKLIPSGRLFIRANVTAIIDGTTPWTNQAIYLTNQSATVAVLTVVILG
jgi:hypothetical protein